MSAIDRMLAKNGKTREDFKPNSRMGKIFMRKGVPNSHEIDRILSIPKSRWQDDASLEEVTEYLTEILKTQSGTMKLRPVQAAALRAIHDFGGLLGPMRVGAGKSLTSFLAPSVVDSKRPLLLIPAKLKAKTFREFKEIAVHWKAHPNLKIMSYELLSRDRGLQELEEFQPDIIIADEVHRLANTRAACTKRVRRYIKNNPTTRFVGMSGTITKRSLLDYHHIQKWALPEGLRPLPERFPVVKIWANALDEKVDPLQRLAPGALLKFYDGDIDIHDQLSAARLGFGNRLRSTPGVIATEEMFDGSMSISITALEYEPSLVIQDAFREMRDTWETPDGHPFTMAVDLWRHCRELSCGFFYRWDPRPPNDWLEARREWSKFVRDSLDRYRNRYDTEMQVARACKNSELPDKLYNAWTDVRNTFKPNSVPVWVDDAALIQCEKWLKKPGICWTEHVAFAERLSARSGIPYYGRQGKDSRGRMIEDETGPCIASIAANCEGRNLQQFSRMLISSIPPGGATFEQALGRVHREGQEADEITVDIMVGCLEQYTAFTQSTADAKYIEQTTGQAQKLLYADVDMIDLKTKSGPLWG